MIEIYLRFSKLLEEIFVSISRTKYYINSWSIFQITSLIALKSITGIAVKVSEEFRGNYSDSKKRNSQTYFFKKIWKQKIIIGSSFNWLFYFNAIKIKENQQSVFAYSSYSRLHFLSKVKKDLINIVIAILIR